jgi:type I restriction enzyme M protein
MLASMKDEGGRVAVVMPHGVLFRAGTERDIRQRILNAGLLRAVVGLPTNLFYSTSIPATILLLHSASSQADGVTFIDASARFKKGRAQNEMTPADIQAVVGAHQAGETSNGVQVRDVPLSEIAANDWDLSLSRYLQVAAPDQLDAATAVAEYHAARTDLRAAEAAFDEALAEAGLGD